MGRRVRVWGVAVCCALIGSAGCGPPTNPKVLRQDVLAADPSFKDTLVKRDDVAERIGVLKRELALKKQEAETQIAKVRQNLQVATERINQKMNREHALLDPDLKSLDLASTMASEELRAKRQQRASMGRSISQLRKALKQSGTPLSSSELAARDRELHELLAESQRLDQELSALASHIRLLKMKRMVLRI